MPPKAMTPEEMEIELGERVDELKDLAEDIKDTCTIGAAARVNTNQETLFKARLSRLDSTYEKFGKVYSDVRKLLKKLNKAVTYSSLKEEVRKAYYDAIAAGMGSPGAATSIPRDSEPGRSTYDIGVHPRLPPIPIPPFSGAISEWAPFKDTFLSLIHNNTNLNHVQRFHYLKSALTGSAAQTICGITISDAGYTQAWDALTKRYDSKRIQATYHIMQILNFKPLLKHDLPSLEQFSAVVMEGVEAFLKLDLERPEGFILGTIALKLLDPRTRDRFELKYGTNPDIFTWEQFSEFIRSQTVQLQSSALLTNPITVSSRAGSSTKPTLRPTNVLFTAERDLSAGQCPICQKGAHRIYDCGEFKKLNPAEKMERLRAARRCINCFASGHIGSACPSTFSCRHCGKRHHSWLHRFSGSRLSPIRGDTKAANEVHGVSHVAMASNPQPTSSSAIHLSSETHTSNASVPASELVLSVTSTDAVLLGTAIVRIQDNLGDLHSIRVLVDSGSQRSFIVSECARRLSLTMSRTTQGLVGFGSQAITGGRYKAACTLVPQRTTHPELRTSAIVIDRICDDMPSSPVPERIIRQFQSYELADPYFHVSRPIDFLLGADLFGEILKGETVRVADGLPSALDSIFGWIVLGPMTVNPPLACTTALQTSAGSQTNADNLSQIMTRFWEIEEVANASKTNPLDAQCEEHFLRTYSRDYAGRFVVKLPFKEESVELGNSKFMALNRFKKLEEKFHRNPDLKFEYSKVLREYLEKEYIVRAANSGKYFLPHHCVLKDSSSTKLRIVFDASAPTNTGSLNDHLLVGPKLQRDIKDVLLSFRIPRVAMSADICQMYLQIFVAPEDRVYQHFFYRFESTDALCEYEFNRLSFGMSCSPFLAIRVLHQLVLEEGGEYPLASSALMNHMYVDDLLTGADSIPEALQLQAELIELLGKAGFTLKKWSSNTPKLLVNVPPDCVEATVPLSNLEDRIIKILGMQWEPDRDCLSYRVQTRDRVETKRGIMSAIARMYDPLGYLAPVVFKAKAILQQLWALKLEWDDPVQSPIAEQWKIFYDELPVLRDIAIPRCIVPANFARLTLVGFADASSVGYAAVVYLHAETTEGSCTAHLLFAKTKLAPLKTISIPRLELCASLLLVNCMHSIRSVTSTWGELPVYLITDSSTVLSWLNLSPHLLKTFVANRVTRILELSALDSWHHVRSQDNAADLASRGLDPSRLPDCSLWWSGPAWLQSTPSKWLLTRVEGSTNATEFPEMKDAHSRVLLSNEGAVWDLEEMLKRFSSFTKLVRVFTYVTRFIAILRKRYTSSPSATLNLKEMRRATEVLVKLVQRYHKLSPIEESNPSIKALSPFEDSQGIVRVGGRLRHASLPYETKHPILLPHRSHFVNLLLDHYHKAYLHAGPQLLLSISRQRYWILAGRRVVRARVHRCLKCHRLRVANITPRMGDLPLTRFEQGRPFLNVGVDFAGPFAMKESNRRKAALGKAYICLFVCFSTKAVHVEVVSQLSTEAFIACFDRFVARRGCPSKVFSDNATNFIGASRTLKELYAWWRTEEVQNTIIDHTSVRGIEWAFIPPASPHFGGLWEAGIKSMKFHVVRVVDSQALTFEELSTVVVRVEAVLNSRPLHPMSSSPEDFQALTPGHFLIGSPLTAPPEQDLTDLPRNRLSRWQFLKRCICDFWNRWRKDYLTCLQQRVKWSKQAPSLTKGTLVLLRESNIPPLQWPMGRVVETYPGQDGVVRVVKIKTAKGEYTRSVTKLSPLIPPDE